MHQESEASRPWSDGTSGPQVRDSCSKVVGRGGLKSASSTNPNHVRRLWEEQTMLSADKEKSLMAERAAAQEGCGTCEAYPVHSGS